MSIGDTTETAILALVFNATAWANYADNAATLPQTVISMALHTADPTDTGTQASSEAGYTGYARASVPRSTLGWTITGGSCSPVASIDFPPGTGGSGTVTFGSGGKAGGGTTPILWSGAVSPNIVTGSGVTPRLSIATTITLD
jgi:hypothetical protein